MAEIEAEDPSDLEDFATCVAELAGKPCWKLLGGDEGTGVSLHLGRKLRVDQAEEGAEEPWFEGEYGLLIECAWELTMEGRPVCSSAGETGWCERLRALEGLQVTTAAVQNERLDLRLTFGGGLRLDVLCDQEDPSLPTYFLYGPSGDFGVFGAGGLEVERQE